MENAIHSKLSEVLNSNVGNKLTVELSVGIQATLQQLIDSLVSQAYSAGLSAQREQCKSCGNSAVVDVDAHVAG